MKYPLGIQTFSELREEGYLYVDKTGQIVDLINSGKAYFLSRPRRFGKSLLISTLSEIFTGNKGLFTDLAITKANYEFTESPVIRMDFSDGLFASPEELKNFIIDSLDDHAAKYQITLNRDNYTQRFKELIVQLQQKTNQKVVLLIDEYDKPILNNLHKPVLEPIKEALSAFYAGIKSQDQHLKFIFITGVTKFAHVSVFSGMNSLTDISMDLANASLCGITQEELEQQLSPQIKAIAKDNQTTDEQLQDKIKHWYNGYRFHPRAPSVYNPYSLLSFLRQKEFRNFWYSTATPTFLLDMLQQKSFDLKELSQFEIGESAFNATEPEQIDVLSLFVQTGYLTIKDYRDPLYVLDFPNFEVKKSFYESLTTRYSHLGNGVSEGYTSKLIASLNSNNLTEFFNVLERFFANIPYDISINLEKYYQSLFFSIFTMIGFNIEAEVSTNIGRIDCVIHTPKHIYIFEFKLNDSKEAALKQIKDNKYPQKYLSCEKDNKKEVVLVGVEFSHETRNITDYISEVVES